MGLTLYSTSGCHLCEQAESLIHTFSHTQLKLTIVDIAQDEQLLAQYGTVIPVLEFADQSQLLWPFNADQISERLQRLDH